jgi:hypothetical protein
MEVSFSEEIRDISGRGTMAFYMFGYNGAKIDILEMNDTLELSSFINKGEKGAGRKLLCHVLKWIRKNKPQYDELTLASVPSSNKYKGMGMTKNNARISLNSYYKSLGFRKNRTNSANRDFTGKMDELLERCLGSNVAGGTRRFNKTRKLKAKPYTRSVIR